MSKLRLKLIVVLAICAAACTFAGCSIGLSSIDDYRSYYNVTSAVTYYSNGGYFDSAVSMTLEYTTGSQFRGITTNTASTTTSSSSDSSSSDSSSADSSSSDSSSSDSSSSGSASKYITRSNYDLDGWYYVAQRTYTQTTEDEGGNVTETSTLYFVLSDDVTDSYLDGFATKESSTQYSYSVSITKPAKNFTVYFVKDTFIENDGKWLITQEDYDTLADGKKYDNTITFPSVGYGDAVDEEMILEDDTHLYVVAMWKESAHIKYYLAMVHGIDDYEATSITTTSSDGSVVVYNEGDYLMSEYYVTPVTSASGTYYHIVRPDTTNIVTLLMGLTLEDATFVAYYYDAACTQPVQGNEFVKPADGASDDEKYISIYMCFITGTDWNIVRTASDVTDMLGVKTSYEQYLLACDIDCSGSSFSTLSAFRIRIEGNNHTISNLTYSVSNLTTDSVTAIFGQLNSTARINNLNIDGLSVSYATRGSAIYAYLLFRTAQSSTSTDKRINNFNINNVTLTITSQSSEVIVRNIGSGGVYESDNWLYGMDNTETETDAQFVELYGGATVTNYTVTIDGTTAISG